MQADKSGTIAHILKASAIMGSSAIVQIVTGIVKNKLVALLLGPVGIGMFALLQSVLTTASTVAGMGLNSSGVRQIAEAEAKGGIPAVASSYEVLKRATLIAALLGAVLIIALHQVIADSISYREISLSNSLAWLAIGVWATTISGAQTALLNGMRRIGDLAKVNSYSALIGMFVTIIVIWLWKQEGVVCAIVCSSIATLLVSWCLVRKINLPVVSVASSQLYNQSGKLVGLGAVFMSSAVMTVGVQFAVRAILTQKLGIEATGDFHAAWTISMLYIGFALNAMGTDYFPRLTAVAADHDASRRLVNEQAEVAILLAAPIILGMLTFAPFVVTILYSNAFSETATILRWQILGDIFKVVAWPMGFVMMAQGKGRLFLFAEVFWNTTYLLLVAYGIKYWGANATGISFFIAYLWLCFLNWYFSYKLIGFTPNKNIMLYTTLLFATAAIIMFTINKHNFTVMILGGFITLLVAVFSFTRITHSLGKSLFRKLHN